MLLLALCGIGYYFGGEDAQALCRFLGIGLLFTGHVRGIVLPYLALGYDVIIAIVERQLAMPAHNNAIHQSREAGRFNLDNQRHIVPRYVLG